MFVRDGGSGHPWCGCRALQNLKNMMVGSKSPMGVMKAAFHWSSSRIWMLLYPQRMSNLVNKVDSFISSMSSGMRGSG